jgi:hypothetical protein
MSPHTDSQMSRTIPRALLDQKTSYGWISNMPVPSRYGQHVGQFVGWGERGPMLTPRILGSTEFIRPG